jgi:hypothetical protein
MKTELPRKEKSEGLKARMSINGQVEGIGSEGGRSVCRLWLQSGSFGGKAIGARAVNRECH